MMKAEEPRRISTSPDSEIGTKTRNCDLTESVTPVSEALARFLRARNAFREKNIDHDEKAPHFACQACQDEGYIFRDGVAYRCQCYSKRLQERFMRHSGIPPYTKHEIYPLCLNYIRNFESIRRSSRNWLALFGRTGSGKSTQAYMVAERLIHSSNPVRVRVKSYIRIISELTALRFDKEEYGKAFWEYANDCDLFVLDDLFDVIPRPNSPEEAISFSLIKERYNSRKPMIITSERTPEAILDQFDRGESIVGRIIEMCNGRIDVARSDTNHRFALSHME